MAPRRYDPEREEARNVRSRLSAALSMGYSPDEATAHANNPGAAPLEDRRRPTPEAPTPPKAPIAAAGSGEETANPSGEPVIPENWEALPWPARLKLAASVSPTAVSNSEDVVAAIEAEIARRKAAKG